jgi:hypothetical protein
MATAASRKDAKELVLDSFILLNLAFTGRQRRCAGAAPADPRTPPSTTSSVPWM